MKIIKKYSVELVRESSKKYDIEERVTSPTQLAQTLETVFSLKNRPSEIFVMLAFDTKLNVVGAFEVFAGALDRAVIHPRDLFQRLLLVNAASFAVAHNHPSGNTAPSKEDIDATKRINKCADLMGMQLIDSIIIGCDSEGFMDYTSLKEMGYL